MLREHAVELGGRHVMGVVAQPRHDLRQFGGQQIARVERDHLPQLHRRTPQMRKAIHRAADVARRQQHVAHPRAFAIGEPSRTLGEHPARDAAGQAPELAQPRQPAARYPTPASPVPILAHAITRTGFRGYP